MSPRARWPLWEHLPVPLLVLGMGTWIGYWSCDRVLTTFDMMILAPVILMVLIALAVVSLAVVTLRTPMGGRIQTAGIHLLVLGITGALLRMTPDAGTWTWEQRILAPRRSALQHYVPQASDLPHRPVTVQGYTFDAYERTPEGGVFFTQELGGPFPSAGIFVPRADDYRGFQPPEDGLPARACSVTPSSVPGIFWLVTRD